MLPPASSDSAPAHSRRSWAPRRVDQPHPGFFALRLVRHGPLVVARIAHADGRWRVVLDTWAHPWAADWVDAPKLALVWERGEEISETEYFRRLAERADALAADPHHPAATPYRPIDLTTRPPVI